MGLISELKRRNVLNNWGQVQIYVCWPCKLAWASHKCVPDPNYSSVPLILLDKPEFVELREQLGFTDL